ncbi:hypothetical protein Tco_0955104 [Tanacetum coccineum]|uniref:Synaptobrevin, longin-like domain protein n=1 Tax=Tanacetum coccineum TaxID=301880 RepID=A0ABQ5E6D0_9ASTR
MPNSINLEPAVVISKTVNGEVQLQALVDGKKIIITESIVRRDLQLEDAEGVDCLPNATIFEQLTLMGYEKISQKLTFYKAFFSPQWKFLIHTILQCLSSKTTAWNEFSSTMASAIICLATNQKFNFSKYIFESMVKNLDNVSGKFLMYPRFVQVFVNQQLEGMPTHKRIYITSSHTMKIFGNMRRVGKGFSGRETPLFQTIMKQRSRRSKRKDNEVPQPSGPTTNVADEAVNEEMDDSLDRAATATTGLEVEQDSGNIDKTQSKATLNESSSSGTSSGNKLRSGEDRLKLEVLMALCTTLQSLVLALETIKTTQATEIASLKKRVKKLERRNKLRTHGLKRLYKVGSSRRVESSEDEGLGEEDASKQGKIADIDANEDIYFVNVQTDEDMFCVNDLDGDEVIVESVNVVKTAKETRSVVEKVIVITIPVSAATTTTTTTTITDVQMTLAQELAELKSAKPKATTITTTPTLTTTAATIITAVSTRPRAKGLAKINADYQLVQRLQAQEQDEFTDVEKARFSKKQKLEEDKEFEELKQCLEIIPDDGDDVTIDATPLSTKSPTIVDYKIYKEGKKSYFQIIRADGNSQMYLTFGKMLKNFDREDLEVLWSIVKARFKKTEPVNYMDNFLLLNLKTMFEHHVEDNVWKNQQGLVKVLNWKLYDSCGVHCVTMQNMLFYLLVEKIYPLTNHTLHQMFNDVKLQVDYECEMAFELLRLVKK